MDVILNINRYYAREYQYALYSTVQRVSTVQVMVSNVLHVMSRASLSCVVMKQRSIRQYHHVSQLCQFMSHIHIHGISREVREVREVIHRLSVIPHAESLKLNRMLCAYTITPLLGPHLSVRLDGLDMLIGIQSVHCALWECDPAYSPLALIPATNAVETR